MANKKQLSPDELGGLRKRDLIQNKLKVMSQNYNT